MSRPDDRIYYQRRAQHARACAARATSPVARLIHLELAMRYARLGTESGEQEPAFMPIRRVG
jgi:hypothetical protein